MKKLLKKIALTLICSLSLMLYSPIMEAKAYETVNFNDYEETNYEISDLNLTDEEIQLANDYIQSQLNDGNIYILPRSVAALSGTFFIPGVGQVIITAAGVIIVCGVVVSAGSALGKKVTNWVYACKQQEAEKASAKIPKSLKKGNGDVNTGKFTQKVKGKQAWKDSKTGWILEKDTANHKGYDGSTKKWKIKNPKGQRIGSLNSNGKVIDK